MKCPCKDCLTLALCKSLDLHDLVKKCFFMSKYLKATKISHAPYSNNVIRIHSNLPRFTHKIRMNKVKRFIQHTHTLD